LIGSRPEIPEGQDHVVIGECVVPWLVNELQEGGEGQSRASLLFVLILELVEHSLERSEDTDVKALEDLHCICWLRDAVYLVLCHILNYALIDV
jgi:hypothetical protein